ncbi:MAG: flagellar hook basal-body protein [Pseudomonadota bacterium]|nr:flagellar hook basal-body protein [Pseudomonadota bacterium]
MFNITRNGLDAIGKELGVISNNIANSNTNAFKRSRSEFVDFYSKALSTNPKSNGGLGTMLQGTQKIMKQGAPILTGSSLDLTISGKGFFVLSPKDGADPRFTRDGSFSLDAQGNLITTEGFNVAGYVRDDNGELNLSSALPINIPLTIESEAKTLLLSGLNINNKGIIETTYGLNTIIKRGQIALAKFNNEIELKSTGSNTFKATEKSGEQILGNAMTSNFGEILSGSLESSNTNISQEMINLIKTQQAFNGNARILQSNVEVTRRLMN